MWNEATEEVRQAYGKKYMQAWVGGSPGADWTTRGDTGPVVKATEHALVSQRPKSRYLVGGSRVFVDIYAVSLFL